MIPQQLNVIGSSLGIALASLAVAVAPATAATQNIIAPPATTAPAPVMQAMPAVSDTARAATISRMQGVWKGNFRRYDAAGMLTETLPSEIHVRFSTDGKSTYQQTNMLTLANGAVQKIESTGVWDGRILRFSNARIDGWFAEVEADPTGLNSVLYVANKDGSGITMSEIITVAADGNSRIRSAQFSSGGKLLRRTLIEETRTSRDPNTK